MLRVGIIQRVHLGIHFESVSSISLLPYRAFFSLKLAGASLALKVAENRKATVSLLP